VLDKPLDVAAFSPQQQAQVRDLVTKINLADSQSIIAFGAAAQSNLSASADQMLDGVRNKDVGPVGGTLSELMIQVRGLGVSDLKPGEQPNWFEKTILGQVNPIARFVQRYETVQRQVDTAVGALNGHKVQLLRDVTKLDNLFEATLDYYHQLEVHIAAAEIKLRELDRQVLPQLRAKAQETGDMLDAQKLRDMSARRDDLERRLYDLRLTRQVTMQSLPQIRLIQDVDKSLISKIQSSILTTIPVWKSQIALAITLWNQRKALETQKAVTDTTNEMLAKNAELLRVGSAEARKEIERGIFDIETVKKVNDELIATINESIQIAEEGRRKRADAEVQMQQMERELKQALVESRARQQQPKP
jgi:uncharacterized protein YaaN involved in tellurite resistance